MLDFSSLSKAIAQLETSLGFTKSDLAQNDIRLAVQFRSATIQAFEYTYELCHKLLKRYLEATDPSPQTIDAMNFQDLIRTGAEKGLLKNSWDVWQLYREAKILALQSYDEPIAVKVFSVIPRFIEDVRFLVTQLQNKKLANDV